MNVSFDWYNVFYYVCEFKSVTRAANFLFVSQPAVTKQIRNLENFTQKKLIYKTPTGIEIIEDGKKLYEKIKNSMEKLNKITLDFNDKNEEYNQTININCGVLTVKRYLLKCLSNFNKKYSNIKFIINAVDSDISLKQLEDGRVDLIFLSIDSTLDKTLNNIKMVTIKESSECFIISPDLKDEIPSCISAEDIKKYPIICKGENSFSRKIIEDVLKDYGVELKPTYQLSNQWLVEEYVSMGMGIGIVVDYLVEEKVKNGEYIKLETSFPLKLRKFGYAYRLDSPKIKIIQELINELSHIM